MYKVIMPAARGHICESAIPLTYTISDLWHPLRWTCSPSVHEEHGLCIYDDGAGAV